MPFLPSSTQTIPFSKVKLNCFATWIHHGLLYFSCFRECICTTYISTTILTNDPVSCKQYVYQLSSVTSVRCLQNAQRTHDPAAICSPCSHKSKDTELSAAKPPDYRAASLLRLLNSSLTLHYKYVYFLFLT